MMLDYAWEPRTLAGLDSLEDAFGMGQLPCCPPGTTSTPANPCYDCPPSLWQLYTGSAPSATPPPVPVPPAFSLLGQKGNAPTSNAPCPAGLADPTLVSLYGPCTVQTFADGSQQIAYGGVALGALPTPPGSAPFPWTMAAGLLLAFGVLIAVAS